MNNFFKGPVAFLSILTVLFAGVTGYLLVEKLSATSPALEGRFVLVGETCAGFEFGPNTSQVIWRNEIECQISDTNPEYYHRFTTFWLDDKTLVVKDVERLEPEYPPRVWIYIVEQYTGDTLVLKELWMGWGDFEVATHHFYRK